VRITNAKSKVVLLAAAFVGLLTVPGFGADAESWKDETVLISPQGDQTVVRAVTGDKVLFKNADPQLAVEWGLTNARTTVVLAGKYVVSDGIDIPRDDVTLIIDQGAEISLNPDTEHKADIGFRSPRHPGFWKMVPLIWNRGHDRVRVIHLGKLVHSVWQEEKRGKQTFPIVFDGRNEQGTCGLEGGLLLVKGSIGQSCLLLDARGVRVPFLVSASGIDAVLCLEGCEDCKLGMIVNLAPKVGGTTGETVDLNSRNRGIAIERLIGERSNEIIDCNESHATVGEMVSVGKPQKLFTTSNGSGPRWTSRPGAGSVSLDVKQKTILEDATAVNLQFTLPKLPEALPRFSVEATVLVLLKDGGTKVYTKEVEIDVRSKIAAAARDAAPDLIEGLEDADSLTYAIPAKDAKAVHRKALSVLAVVLPRDHLSHHPLDEEIAGRWFDLFINKLDPRRMYFTAGDIRRFAEHRGDLVDHARRGELSFADLVRDTYAERLRQATTMGIELLDERHDFTKDEQFELRPKGFPKDADALRERWRKRVKFEILVERSAGLSRDRAVARLRARYRRVARENRLDDDEELYELYLDAFARSFGPHNWYLGERTLAGFRS